ncbi:MAG: transposase, partial [Hyphomicrobiales bacterium]|nr:transposase [Hyphomicrobiales bacterium]
AVARSHGLNPQQLFGWRKRFRREASALMASPESAPAFAPAIVEPALSSAAPATLVPPQPCSSEGSIEVSVGGATIRIRGAVDAKTLALVLKALKVLA